MFKQNAEFSYFEKPAVEMRDDEILAFTTLRNEVERLPYFLEYYRKLGVSKFFVVDNGSNDGSSELLKSCDDVIYFYTEESYKGSGAGRDWLYELAHNYGIGHWCLTLDVDELLVYPGIEQVNLHDFCGFLDMEGAQALFCVFLDFYSDKKLSETKYEPGTPFLKTCPFYETATYRLVHNVQAPFLSVTGGPRWRLFWGEDPKKIGPMMRKVPLVKWDEGFHYIYSTHSHSDRSLSSITGVLQHFKFFSFFRELAAQEARRGDRRQPADYHNYAATLEDDPLFITPVSKKYENSGDFIRDGISCSTPQYLDFVKSQASLKGVPSLTSLFPRLQDANIVNYHSGDFNLSAIGRIWPFVNNPAFFKNKLRDKVKALLPRERLERLSELLTLRDVIDGKLLFSIPEEAWELIAHDVVLRIGTEHETMLQTALCDAGFKRRERSLVANIFEIPSPQTLQEARLKGRMVSVDIAIADGERLRLSKSIRQLGHCPGDRFSGVCEKFENGQIAGWIYDRFTAKWDTPVALYVNDIYCGWSWLGNNRADLLKKVVMTRDGKLVEANISGSDFAVEIPQNLLSTENQALNIVLKAACHPFTLERTPFEARSLNAKWNGRRREWQS